MRTGIQLSTICLFIVISIFPLPACVFGAADPPASLATAEAQLISLINSARKNPLDTAKSMGLSLKKLYTSQPHLQEPLAEGLQPLIYNGNLYMTADEQTAAAVADNFRQASLAPLDERLKDYGYIAASGSETVSSIAFTNYLSPSVAAEKLFRRIFQQEINAKKREKLRILNPDFTDMGLSLHSGRMTSGRRMYNGYLLTVDYAENLYSLEDLEFLQLVNQARQYPQKVADTLAIKLEEDASEEMAPVVMDELLFTAVRDHAPDLLQNDESGDAEDVAERILDEYGFDADPDAPEPSEIYAVLNDDDPAETDDVGLLLFLSVLEADLAADKENRILLNPAFREAGIYYETILVKEDDAEKDIESSLTKHILAANLATHVDRQPHLLGTVYSDVNRNGLYDIREGLQNINVTISGTDTNLDIFTNQAGGFTLPLSPGIYEITTQLPGSKETSMVEVEIADDNVGIYFSN